MTNIDDDNTIETLLAKALARVEPVSTQALSGRGYAAFDLGAVDAELAELVFDSLLAPEPLLMRGSEGETRMLSFANDQISLDVTLFADGRTIVGEISPPEAAEVIVEAQGGESISIPIDSFGRFHATSADPSIRFRVVGRLLTPWISRRT